MRHTTSALTDLHVRARKNFCEALILTSVKQKPESGSRLVKIDRSLKSRESDIGAINVFVVKEIFVRLSATDIHLCFR